MKQNIEQAVVLALEKENRSCSLDEQLLVVGQVYDLMKKDNNDKENDDEELHNTFSFSSNFITYFFLIYMWCWWLAVVL